MNGRSGFSVALDKACLDLVNAHNTCPDCELEMGDTSGADKFAGLWKWTRGDVTFSYGEAMGLGTPHYELIRL